MIVDLLPRIAADIANEERRRVPWRPRCSSAGTERCVRAEVYRALGATPAPLPGRTALVFDDGAWHEELSLDLMRKSAYRVHSEQLAVDPAVVPGSHDGYYCGVCKRMVEKDMLHGHLDAMLTSPTGEDYVLEHKSASRFSFQRWASGHEVPWDYVTQSAFYVYGARLVGAKCDRAILVVKNKDTSAYLEFVIDVPTRIGNGEEATVIESATVMEGEQAVGILLADEHRSRRRLLGDAIDRFTEVVACRDTKALPSRPFEFGHWRCDYCAFGTECWRGYTEDAREAKADPPIALGRDDADLVRAVAAANAVKSQSDRVARDLKAKLKVRLMELGTRAAWAEDGEATYRVRLDVRSRTTLDADLVPDAVRKAAEKVTEFEVLAVSQQRKET